MKYWIYLNPDVFIWTKGSQAIVYNTVNNQSFRYKLNDSLRIITNNLCNIDNLYCIEIDNLDSSIESWVEKIKDIEAGGIREVEEDISNMPISFYPILNLQSDEQRFFEKNGNRFSRDNVLSYLHHLTIHLNGIGDNYFYKQIQYPCPSKSFLSNENLRLILTQFYGYIIPDICICGTNYFSLLSEDLISLIYKVSKRLTFFVLFEDYFTDFERIKSLSGSYYKIRLLTKRSSFSMENIGAIINNEKIQFDFIVENVDDCMYWDTIIEELNIQNYVIKPIANKNNTQFILDNVFLTQSEILQLKFNKREIFSHQVLNSNFFGHLIITPEGKVYSNFNKPELGTINDSIKFLLSKELKLKNSWLLIRDNVECSNCLYQWLCPSISNYELYLQTKCIKND